jgi:hypothetical protein
VKVGAADEMQLLAGNGFAGTTGSPGHPGQAGRPGGSISNITINNAFIDPGANSFTPSYYLLAGDGGSGSSGGAGGSIRTINEVSSSGVVNILAGQGGTGTTGPGGAGGSIATLNMQSDSSTYTVHAGTGGAGAPGGAGGKVTAVNFGGNELSNGIIVSAPFTGGTADDILLINSVTGTMVIEQNDGNGTGFTPVIQDPVSLLTTIAPIGSTPVGAVAVDLTGNGLPDIVVAYKGTENVGVFMNQGGGVFYQEDFTKGVYAGDTLEAQSVPLLYAPTQVAAGNFFGNGPEDVAVLINNGGQTELETLQGNGTGGLSALKSVMTLSSNPVSLIAANIPGQAYTALFAGFKTGELDTLLATGSSSSAPFSLAAATTVAGGITNLDYDAQDNLLLALNGTGSTLDVYAPNTAGSLLPATSIVLTGQPGTALVAHFAPISGGAAEPIEVLSAIGAGSQLDVYSLQGSSYALTSSTQSTEALKNFVPVAEGSTSGVAAVGGSVEHFAFSQNGGAFYDVGIPFSGKTVNIVAGDGGDGNNTVTDIARGGAGGDVYGMNILAGNITVQAGNGGSSENAPAGAGGYVENLPVLTIGDQSLPTIIEADYVLTIGGGAGGSASGSAHGGSGGAGGSVQGLDLSLEQGNILISSGNGGDGGGGAGGNGGMVMALTSVDYQGNLSVTAGNGGSAGAIGNGGAGGSITNLTHSLSLGTNQTQESPYNVTLTAGSGGASSAAFGGLGGSVGNINLTLQPSNESVNNPLTNPTTVHTNVDSTLRVVVTAGNGGNGATGGAGGSVKALTSSFVFDQIVTVIGATSADNYSFPEINPVAAQITAGNGGNGSTAAGGAGGAVSKLTFIGISSFDPDSADPQAGQAPLLITSGNGGNGATMGGVGGAVTGVTSENAVFIDNGATTYPAWTELTGATVISGHGGNGGTKNGGAGGAISKLNLAVQGWGEPSALSTSGTLPVFGGEITVQSGAGGNGGAAGKGGAGGSIGNSVLGCVDEAEDYGLLLRSGGGGGGVLGGGAGGNVTNIQLNAPQNPMQDAGYSPYDALSTVIMAGNGGSATGATAVGGVGGSISQISETKDVNSSINLLQAGNGGAAVATGGLGGSVTGVKTVGLIGQASDDAGNTFGAFQTAVDISFFHTLFPGGVPEGVFSGRGGTGTTDGLAGSVTSIVAAQIAAIGAAANSQGLFAAAEKVANITAEVIGYDVNGNGQYDNVTGTNRTSPADARAIDGFLFSITAATGIHVSDPTELEAFTFVG